LRFSIVIPVYNRPQEIEELLQSIVDQQFAINFEVVIIEDGSKIMSESVVDNFKKQLDILYLSKENSGPGDTRNFGMQRASGDYFIILDSDCILPKMYLHEVYDALNQSYTDAFGGADSAHPLFSDQQKAINYSMTSFLTTGGLRGSEKAGDKFQLRSFNMGISKDAFLKTGGFSKQYYGEDIDLTFKLWKNDLKTQFIPAAFVYHKRRSTWEQFFKQTFNFGAARPVLNKMHPNTAKITFWFPSLFIIGFLISLVGLCFNFKIGIAFYTIYFILIFVDSLWKNKFVSVAILSVYSSIVQFLGYGSGFLRSIYRLKIQNRSVENTFPEMFVR